MDRDYPDHDQEPDDYDIKDYIRPNDNTRWFRAFKFSKRNSNIIEIDSYSTTFTANKMACEQDAETTEAHIFKGWITDWKEYTV